jgi:hypothetical protein
MQTTTTTTRTIDTRPPAFGRRAPRTIDVGPYERWAGQVALAVVAAILAWNAVVWFRVRQEPDNAYRQLSEQLAVRLDRGTQVGVATDVGSFLLPSVQPVAVTSPEDVDAKTLRYVLVGSKDAERRYGSMTPAFYRWLQDNGDVVLSVEGRTYARLSLFRIRGR